MYQSGEEWFGLWFDSPYYPLLYCHRDHNEAKRFIKRLMGHLNMAKGERALDLACGSGRHAIQLAELGLEVIGIDLSERAISEANATAQGKVDFFVHDIRHLFWDQHFQLVVNLFTSYGYFHNREDDLKVMRSVHDALVPGGYFVIDYLNAPSVIKNLVPQETVLRDQLVFNIVRQISGNMVVKEIEVIDGEAVSQFREEVDLITLGDFEELMSDAGLSIMETFGSYELETYNNSSPRLIIIAERPLA